MLLNLETMIKNLVHIHPEWDPETIRRWARPSANGRLAIITIHRKEMDKWQAMSVTEQRLVRAQRLDRVARYKVEALRLF